MTLEKMLGIKVPERAQYIRIIMCELSRVSDHLTALAAMTMESGAFTVFLYKMKAREYIWDVIEQTTGARMTTSYIRIGGVRCDLHPQWRDAPSKVFLEEAARQVAKRNGRLVNVDSMLIAEEPKIGLHIEAMKTNVASALGIPTDSVGIKATTNETLGFVGRSEGMAAHAVASVDLPG